MKVHLNLATRDLSKSVAFYQTLLAAAPTKHFSDYALFLTEKPGLELALDADPTVKVAEGAHYGIVVDSPDQVDGAIARLQESGYRADVERDGRVAAHGEEPRHRRRLGDALRSGDVKIEGSRAAVERFLQLFPPPKPAAA